MDENFAFFALLAGAPVAMLASGDFKQYSRAVDVDFLQDLLRCFPGGTGCVDHDVGLDGGEYVEEL